MAIREGRWDCATCGAKGLLGRDKICPQCGDPRAQGVKFYLPEDAAEVTDAAHLQVAKAGPDWLCLFCNSSNRAAAKICEQCGAERGAAPTQAVKEYALGEVPRTGDGARETPIPAPAARKAIAPAPRRPLPLWVKLGLAMTLAALVGGCGILWLVSRPRDVTLTVAQMSWERTIEIEAFRTLTEEGWSLPPGGRLQSQRPEIHHYVQVLDHHEKRTRQVAYEVQVGEEEYVSGQRDLGNGFFEDIVSKRPIYETRYRTESYDEPIYRQEPVLQTRYTYQIDRWVTDRAAKAAGQGRDAEWPKLNLAPKERAGRRTASYLIRFEGPKGKTYDWRPSEDKWRQFKPGAKCKAKVSGFGKLIEAWP
jgi:hypothetical protein